MSRKSWFLLILLLLLVVSLGFGVGYLVGKEFSPAPVIIEDNSK